MRSERAVAYEGTGEDESIVEHGEEGAAEAHELEQGGACVIDGHYF